MKNQKSNASEYRFLDGKDGIYLYFNICLVLFTLFTYSCVGMGLVLPPTNNIYFYIYIYLYRSNYANFIQIICQTCAHF